MPNPPPATLRALHAAFRRGAWRPSEVVEFWLARPAAARGHPVWISVGGTRQASRARAWCSTSCSRPIRNARSRCRSSACCSRSRTTSTSPACRPPPPARPSPTRRARTRRVVRRARSRRRDRRRQDQPRPVRHRPRRHALAVRRGAQRVRCRATSPAARARARRSRWRRGLVHFALGTDTAGSGRVPAGLNNIVGLKPTRGLLSHARRGAGVPVARLRLDLRAARSPIAARVLAAAMGHDPRGPLRRAPALGPAAAREPFTLRACRARRSASSSATRRRPARLRRAPSSSCARWAARRARSTSRRWRAVARMLYDGPRVAERHAAHPRVLRRTQPEALDPTVRGIIAGGRGYSATDAFVARRRGWPTLRATLARDVGRRSTC